MNTPKLHPYQRSILESTAPVFQKPPTTDAEIYRDLIRRGKKLNRLMCKLSESKKSQEKRNA